jgi:hypothetical protein
MRGKVKEDEIGIEIAGARSLSSEAGEGGGVAKQIGRILNHESSRQTSTTGAGRKLQGKDHPSRYLTCPYSQYSSAQSGPTGPSRLRNSSGKRPVTRTCFSRPVWPRTIWIRDSGTSKRSLRNRLNRSLALPSTGGAFSRIFNASPWIPTISSRAERGVTRTVSNKPSFVSRRNIMSLYGIHARNGNLRRRSGPRVTKRDRSRDRSDKGETERRRMELGARMREF